MGKKDLKIKKPYLLLCEGVDEQYFLIWYLDFLISSAPKNKILDDIQVLSYGGIEELTKMLEALTKMQDFEMV